MGDRYAGGPFAEATFLGGKVRLPAAAYSLAAATGAPVAILLSAKTGRRTYDIRLYDSFYPEMGDRTGRREKLDHYARRFAKAMTEYVSEYPYQWYNFFDFWSQ